MSSESSNFLIDWRPSRLLIGALAGLGGLAALALWLGALPFPAKVSMAALALALGFRMAFREARRPAFCVRVTVDESGLMQVQVAGHQMLASPSIRVRGPLAGVSGRGSDGRLRHILWWPDTLSAASRRALRLASGNRVEQSGPALATMSG